MVTTETEAYIASKRSVLILLECFLILCQFLVTFERFNDFTTLNTLLSKINGNKLTEAGSSHFLLNSSLAFARNSLTEKEKTKDTSFCEHT